MPNVLTENKSVMNLKVLIVCNGTPRNNEAFNLKQHHPFIYEQVEAIKKQGVEFDFFYIEEKGIKGYFKSIIKLRKFVRANKYDLVHAHYGLSGMVAVMQSRYPVITTYHGSDVNKPKINLISSFVTLFSKANIFVSHRLSSKIYVKTPKKNKIIPCGIDSELFTPVDKKEARSKTGMEFDGKTILFAAAKNNPVKNYSLARNAVDRLEAVELIELTNKSREEVKLYMNACDLFLMTSFSEGSPQTIKEAMSCNCPIVSTDVGDVKEVINGTEGCYICSYEPEDVAEKIMLALDFTKANGRTNGRKRVLELEMDNKLIADKIIELYKSVRKI